MSKKTLLVIVPGSNKGINDFTFALLVAETGEALCSHFCSSASWAYNDLYGRRDERIKEFKERFGEVEVKFVNETNIKEKDLLKRNHEWHANLEKEKEVQDG